MKLSDNAEKRIEQVIKEYPHKRSAIMTALYIAQEELGHINEQAINWVAERVEVAPVQVMEVATFYTMYYKQPVGKYHIQVCRTLSCALCGAKKISKYLHERLGLKPNQISADGMWSYEEVECLGSCGTAPMVEINDTFFENLDTEKLESIMRRIEQEKPNLRISAISDDLGQGLKGLPKSEVI